MTHFTNRQAIQTKFLPATNSRGSRVKAFASAGSVTIGWDHRLNPEQNHRAAAEMISAELECQDWFQPWTRVSWGNLGTELDPSRVDEILLTYARCFYFGE